MIVQDKKTICYITETGRKDRPILDPSARYRCFHPSEILTRRGHFCSIYSAQQFHDNPNYDFDVYIFHRPNTARSGFTKTIEFLRKNGRVIVADYDDLVFGDDSIALESSVFKNGILSSSDVIKSFKSNLDALTLFDLVTTSTTPLADQVRRFNPYAEVHTISNILPPSLLGVHHELGTHVRPRSATAIGYFAGTRSHDKDLPIASEVLQRVLLENQKYSLLIVGPVSIPPSLASLPNVIIAPAVSFMRLPALMTMCSTVIAPLESTGFNMCKSRVKFLESALSGCRLIATPIPDMKAVGVDRLTLAADLDEWYEALSNLEEKSYNYTATENANFLNNGWDVSSLEVVWGS